MKSNRFLLMLFAGVATLCTPVVMIACGSPTQSHYTTSLPVSEELSGPRGYRVARVVTHFHSPYSWDACDHNGVVNGKPNQDCLAHLKHSLCMNHVDYLFLTDHPDNMADYEMSDLVLDTTNAEASEPTPSPSPSPSASESPTPTPTESPATQLVHSLEPCSDGFVSRIEAGFEDKVMAMGMTKHLETDPKVRRAIYASPTPELVERLHKESDALVFIPHTESKSVDWIKSLKPDGIEIYNFHANVDPKIRKKNLDLPPFKPVAGLMPYLADPYHELNADFSFLAFLEVSPVYGKMWSSLVGSGLKVAGIGGTDSHENVFAQKGSDGERLDGHRRITRMMSNHFLVKTLDPVEMKEAMRAGRGWMVFEGLGSPVGMDFYAEVNGNVTGVGDSGTLAEGEEANIVVKLPTLHPSSPQGPKAPQIQIKLKQVLTDGTDQVVAESTDADLNFKTSKPGPYRAELSIRPHHLEPYIKPFQKKATEDFLWIETNHLYLTR
jgi:hypothetical protein